MRESAVKATGTFASLSSSLLARKGGAKPAMRPSLSTSLDDLGWNDMGEDMAAAPVSKSHYYPEPRKYQEAIAEEFGVPVEPVELAAPVAATVSPIKSAPRVARKVETAIGKVAFTLRLDAERHLRLRLACAVSNRSAQKVVTDALDAFLRAHPEIDQLADQIPPHKTDGHD